MRRLAALLLGALLAIELAAGAVGASPNVGSHTHVQVTGPADGAIVNGPTTYGIRILSHNQIGAITSFRVSDSSTVKQTIPVSLPPCGMACELNFTFTIDFSSWSTGRHELRWTANIPHNSEGNRQYQSTGHEVCVRSCSPNVGGRSTPWLEARGWYTGHGYQNARLKSPTCDVRSGGMISIDLTPGSGGKATKFSGVYINPNFHALDHGIVVGTWSGAHKGTITLPVVAEPFALVLLASDGQNAGVLKIPSGQCSSSITYESQGWWASAGLVVP